MPTTTANLAFPKPEATDRLRDGWDAIADLADALDAYLFARAGKRQLKPSDTIRNSGAASTYDPDLFGFTFPAYTEWEVNAYLGWTASTSTQDVKISWGIAGTGAVMGSRWCVGQAVGSTDETNAAVMVSSVRTPTDPAPYGISGIAVHSAVRETFRFATGSAAALFSLAWSPINTAAGGTVTLKAGSFITAHRIIA